MPEPEGGLGASARSAANPVEGRPAGPFGRGAGQGTHSL